MMDNSDVLEGIGGRSRLRRLQLLLLLAGLQPLLSAGQEPELRGNGLQVFIVGPDYVTEGVPASVACDGNCPRCTYWMSLEGEAPRRQGKVLGFTVNTSVEAVTATCTAGDAQVNATATKRLRVLVGPANVSITGSGLTNASLSYTYTCHAHCRPSCTYAWRVDDGAWVGGDVMSVIPQETYGLAALTCQATNSVSGMFASATQTIAVTRSGSNLSTRPVGTVLLLGFMLSAALLL